MTCLRFNCGRVRGGKTSLQCALCCRSSAASGHQGLDRDGGSRRGYITSSTFLAFPADASRYTQEWKIDAVRLGFSSALRQIQTCLRRTFPQTRYELHLCFKRFGTKCIGIEIVRGRPRFFRRLMVMATSRMRPSRRVGPL